MVPRTLKMKCLFYVAVLLLVTTPAHSEQEAELRDMEFDMERLMSEYSDDDGLPPLLGIMKREETPLSEERLKAALAWGREQVKAYEKIERKTKAGSKKRHSSHYHFGRSTNAEQLAQAREALAWVEAARAPADLDMDAGRQTDVTCPVIQTPSCSLFTRYRRMDGACNNFFRRLWGASDTPLVRYAPNTFDDNVHAVRTRAADGGTLKSARRISDRVTRDQDVENEALTLSAVNWGQFMDHDITLSPIFLAEPGVELQCCEDGEIITDNAHPQCLPIEIPANDGFYSQHNQRCMEFARSLPSVPLGCQSGPAIAQNVLTAFIDGSGVYGSRDSRAELLRSFSGGLLATQGDNLLPPDPAGVQIDTETPCLSTDVCMVAGDVRANEQSGLLTLHTIWLREHNRIATALAANNPGWNDERLFQEARKIVGAELQHITYNEWLPIILGEEYMNRQNINTQQGGFYSFRYSPFVNPTIATEFSSAAFRFGHTLIQGSLNLYETLSNPPPASTSLAVQLRDVFFNPSLVYQGRLDEFAIGMVTQHPQFADSNFADDLTEHLFQEGQHEFGLDLISLNIQRGRDHGIATYNTMRERCGLGRASRFRDLRNEIPRRVRRRLRRVYDSVDDIDLFIGAVSERPAPGAVIGPTMQCIVGDQFTRLRWGDNFFYDLGGPFRPWRFRLSQLRELKKTSWARVLCDTIGSITSIQPQAFRSPSGSNAIGPCSDLPSVDLSRW